LSYPSFTFQSPVVGYFIETKKSSILEQELQKKKRAFEHELEQETQLIKSRLFIRD